MIAAGHLRARGFRVEDAAAIVHAGEARHAHAGEVFVVAHFAELRPERMEGERSSS